MGHNCKWGIWKFHVTSYLWSRWVKRMHQNVRLNNSAMQSNAYVNFDSALSMLLVIKHRGFKTNLWNVVCYLWWNNVCRVILDFCFLSHQCNQHCFHTCNSGKSSLTKIMANSNNGLTNNLDVSKLVVTF